MRITLVISSLQGGGAERVMSVMANYWAARGWPVTLLTWAGPEEPVAYDLDKRVRFRPLGVANVRRNPLLDFRNVARLLTLRRAIRESRPDVVVSFLDKVNVVTLLAMYRLNTPVIVMEHTHPSAFPIGAIWNALRCITYRFAERIIVLSEQSLACFSRRVQSRAAVIPNPVLRPAECAEAVSCDGARPHVVAMGRLAEEKGFDILLRAFADVAARHPDWVLRILGEGPLRGALERQRDSLRLGGRVEFAGFVPDPHAWLRKADVFVLSSRFEGFPNALCEAMACGLPAVATDCPTGPGEIIRDGVDGLLVPVGDSAALAAAMDRLMSDETLRRRLGTAAKEVVERFGVEKVMGMWDRLFAEVCGN